MWISSDNLSYWSAYPNPAPTQPSLSQGGIRLPLKLWILTITTATTITLTDQKTMTS